MISLDDMALFVAVVEAKSFTQAADKTAVPKSTLSVRISKLEQALGVRLLNRTTRKIELTEAGAIYYQRAAQLVQEASAIHQQLDAWANQPSGALRVSLPVDFAYNAFAPLALEFCQRFPQIQLELDITPRRVDLISEPFDVVIRAGNQPDSALIGWHISSHTAHLYAAPSYLQQVGAVKNLHDLTACHCLGFKTEQWTLFNGDQTVAIPIRSSIKANSYGMIQRLASAGCGIALLPDIAAKPALANGELVALFPDWHSHKMPVYALTTTKLLPAKTNVFIEFLREKLG